MKAKTLIYFVLGAVTVMALEITFQTGKKIIREHFQPVPVKITYRRSVIGNGFVFQFTDVGPTELFCTVVVRSSTDGQEYRLDLKPGEFKEVGVLEGWQAFPGDTCTVEAEGYSNIQGRIPRDSDARGQGEGCAI